MKLMFLLMFLFSFALHAETVTLNNENTVFLNDVVYGESVTKALGELAAKESNSEPTIYLVLSTPGGSVFAGLNLMHYLKNYKKPVKTVTIFAASMGFQIAQGNPGDRLIVDTGILMSHPMSGGFFGELGDGLSAEKRNGYIKEVIQTMDEQVVTRTKGKQTLEGYRKAYDNELWTTGKNAVEAGYADGVVNVSCSPALTESVDKYFERSWLRGSPLAFEIKYETSKCPLMMGILRYEIALVDITSGDKFVLYTSGYQSESSSSENKNQSTSYRSPGKLGIDSNEMQKNLDGNVRYQALQFLLNRKMEGMKNLNWL